MKKLLVLGLVLAVVCAHSAAFALVTDPLANDVFISPILKEPGSVTLNIGISQSSNISSYDDNYLTDWIEEKTGISLEFTLFPSSDATAKLDMLVTSGEKLPDIICFGTDRVRVYNYAVNGAVIPLTEYYKRDVMGGPFYKRAEYIGVDPELILNEMKLADGHIYGSIYRDNNFANNNYLRAFINQTWLDKLGLQAPGTSDELVAVLTAFRDDDPNGNGQKDEIPMMGQETGWGASSISYLQNMFIYYDGDGNYMLPLSQTGGTLDVSYDKDEYREAMIFINKLVKEGLLDETSFTQDTTTYNAIRSSNPAVVGLAVGGGANPLYLGNSPDAYVPLEVCAGPAGVRWATLANMHASMNSVISSDCAHPEIAFLLTQYVNYDDESFEYFYIQRWGKQGEDWRFAEPDELGMFSDFGYPPNLLVLKPTWGVVNNHHWQGAGLMNNICYAPEIMEVFDGSKTNPEYWYAQNYGLNRAHTPSPEDLLPRFNYTLEETDQWADARTALKTYVNEARVFFAVGQLDPNNDDTWQAYLNELNVLQYQEILAVDQAAYDRSKAQ